MTNLDDLPFRHHSGTSTPCPVCGPAGCVESAISCQLDWKDWSAHQQRERIAAEWALYLDLDPDGLATEIIARLRSQHAERALRKPAAGWGR